MPAGPVAVRHGERSAQGVCFFLPRSCRGAHFIGPWLVVDVRFDVWFETRGDAREPRGVGRFVGVLGGVSRPEFGGLVLRGSSVVGRRIRGQILADLPARYRCEGEGVAQCLRCPACSFASHSGCASTLSINS